MYPCSAVLGKQLAGCSGKENQVAGGEEKCCRRGMSPEHGTGAEANCTGRGVGRSQKLLALVVLLK